MTKMMKFSTVGSSTAPVEADDGKAWVAGLTEDEVEGLPCVRLKALRTRCKLTAKQCAEHAGMGNATSWYVYENVERMRDRKIPYKVIKPMMSLMVGRGRPPVTHDELIFLTEIEDVQSAMKGTEVQQKRTSVVNNFSTMFTNQTQNSTLLPIRFRVERSVYLPEDMIASRTFGVGPIGMAGDFKAAQSCCIVADNDGGIDYPQGTVLHLVDQTEFVQHQLVGKRVVLSVVSKKIGLGEVRLARVVGVTGNEVVTHTMSGEPIEGTILGVVVGRYARE